jgi:putative ABC transport system substrate-binding protein
VKRRDFITLLGGAAAWPLAARAQLRMPVIGVLRTSWLADSEPSLAAFREGLKQTGYIESQNVAIEYRFAEDRDDQLPILAADLIRHQVSIIYAAPHSAALAAQHTTATIPIVFVAGTDPVMLGLVASFNRPGGNITGAYFAASDLASKRLDLLHQAIPKAKTIAVLMNPNRDSSPQQTRDTERAADALHLEIFVLHASSQSELDAAFPTAIERGAEGLIVGADAFFGSRRKQIVALAARYRLPTMYDPREAVDEGGLMSYGINRADAARQAGIYVGRILKGEKPADLPVVQPNRFELVINIRTAEALGLDLPPTLLAIADEVIE